jgi:hypothetical protein
MNPLDLRNTQKRPHIDHVPRDLPLLLTEGNFSTRKYNLSTIEASWLRRFRTTTISHWYLRVHCWPCSSSWPSINQDLLLSPGAWVLPPVSDFVTSVSGTGEIPSLAFPWSTTRPLKPQVSWVGLEASAWSRDSPKCGSGKHHIVSARTFSFHVRV